MQYFFYYIDILMTAFLMIFRRFPKIFQNCSEGQTNVPEHFREFPKTSEDVRRLPKAIEEDAKMFRWYTNRFRYNLRDKLHISEISDIFTCNLVPRTFTLAWGGAGKGPGIGWSHDPRTPKYLGCTKLKYVKRYFQDGGLFE